MPIFSKYEIVLRDGTVFNLEQPSPLPILTIADVLSRIPRWNSHVKSFYSVAQHSLVVAGAIPEDYDDQRVYGLLHDAAEAVIGDIPSPLKLFMRGGRGPSMLDTLEEEIHRVILEGLGIDPAEEIPWVIKAADIAAAAGEAYTLMPDVKVGEVSLWHSTIGVADPPKPIFGSTEQIKERFLAAWDLYMNDNDGSSE